MDNNLAVINKYANKLSWDAQNLSNKINELNLACSQHNLSTEPFMFNLSLAFLSCVIGYFLAAKINSHMQIFLTNLSNILCGVIIIVAIKAVSVEEFGFSQLSGFLALLIISINIFGGLIITYRMILSFRKK